MRLVMVNEGGDTVFAGESTMLKSHVAAYTRKDGTFVKEHDDKRQKKMGEGGGDPYGGHPSVVGKFSYHKVAGDGGRGEKDGNGDPTHPSTTSVGFAGKHYRPTGKTGQSLHDKTPVHEFESDDGHRVWGDAEGRVHADSSDEVDHLRSEHENGSGGGEQSGSGLPAVSDRHISIMEDSLSNDEDSSDHELIDLFVQNGVDRNVAAEAVKYRDKFMNGVMETGSLKEMLSGSGEGNDMAAGLKPAKAEPAKPADKKVLFSKPAADSAASKPAGKYGEGADRLHPTGEKKKGASSEYTSMSGESGKMEGGIHPISADPGAVEKKLGLKSGSLGDADGHYSQTHTVTDKDGHSHHVYANGGEVRIRPVGKATPESTKALKEYLDGVGSGSPDYDGAGKANGEMKHGAGSGGSIKSENEGYGYHGEAMNSYIREKHGDDTYHGSLSEKDYTTAKDAGHKKFSEAASKLVSGGHFDNIKQAAEYLDSRHGRHLHDGATFHGGDISKVKWLAKDVADFKKNKGKTF